MHYRLLASGILCALIISCGQSNEVGESAQPLRQGRGHLVGQVRDIVAANGLAPVEPLPIPNERDEIYELGRMLAFDVAVPRS